MIKKKGNLNYKVIPINEIKNNLKRERGGFTEILLRRCAGKNIFTNITIFSPNYKRNDILKRDKYISLISKRNYPGGDKMGQVLKVVKSCSKLQKKGVVKFANSAEEKACEDAIEFLSSVSQYNVVVKRGNNDIKTNSSSTLPTKNPMGHNQTPEKVHPLMKDTIEAIKTGIINKSNLLPFLPSPINNSQKEKDIINQKLKLQLEQKALALDIANKLILCLQSGPKNFEYFTKNLFQIIGYLKHNSKDFSELEIIKSLKFLPAILRDALSNVDDEGNPCFTDTQRENLERVLEKFEEELIKHAAKLPITNSSQLKFYFEKFQEIWTQYSVIENQDEIFREATTPPQNTTNNNNYENSKEKVEEGEKEDVKEGGNNEVMKLPPSPPNSGIGLWNAVKTNIKTAVSPITPHNLPRDKNEDLSLILHGENARKYDADFHIDIPIYGNHIYLKLRTLADSKNKLKGKENGVDHEFTKEEIVKESHKLSRESIFPEKDGIMEKPILVLDITGCTPKQQSDIKNIIFEINCDHIRNYPLCKLPRVIAINGEKEIKKEQAKVADKLWKKGIPTFENLKEIKAIIEEEKAQNGGKITNKYDTAEAVLKRVNKAKTTADLPNDTEEENKKNEGNQLRRSKSTNDIYTMDSKKTPPTDNNN